MIKPEQTKVSTYKEAMFSMINSPYEMLLKKKKKKKAFCGQINLEN